MMFAREFWAQLAAAAGELRESALGAFFGTATPIAGVLESETPRDNELDERAAREVRWHLRMVRDIAERRANAVRLLSPPVEFADAPTEPGIPRPTGEPSEG